FCEPFGALIAPSPCVIWPSGSLARRPVYRIAGCNDELDVLYPSATSPIRSIATLPIQRNAESGAYVPCWYTVGEPFGLRSSYQRTPTAVPAVTALLTTSDSWSPKLRYASRYISRSAS